MKVSIIGLGKLGRQLAHVLKENHSVIGTTRSEEKLHAFSKEGITAFLLHENQEPKITLFEADVIVLNIPPNENLGAWIKKWPWKSSTHVIFISSTSVYGNNSGAVDENSTPFPATTNAHQLLTIEEWIKTFSKFTIIRLGGLIGPEHNPGKFLAGRKNIEGGNWPVNLVSTQDAVRFIKLIIERQIFSETFSLVNPSHPTRREYYEQWCINHNLPAPEFIDSTNNGKLITDKNAISLFQFSDL